MNIQIGDFVVMTVEGAYALEKDGKVLGYHPSLEKALGAYLEEEINSSEAETIGELLGELRAFRHAATGVALEHAKRPASFTGSSETVETSDPERHLPAVHRAFMLLTNQEPRDDDEETDKIVNKIIAMHAMASKLKEVVQGKSDLYRRIALDYYGFADVDKFRELPQAREHVTEIKTILKPWFEDQEQT